MAEIDSQSLADFVAMSAALTGIATDALAPPLSDISVAQEIYLRAQGQGRLLALIQTYKALVARHLTPDQIASAITTQATVPEQALARAIILAWYLGSWYEPGTLENIITTQQSSGFVPSSVISEEAYTRSWTWSVAQTHPMGYSNQNFGYWQSPPPPLSDFINGEN